jgi:serine/threonine-protein kinase
VIGSVLGGKYRIESELSRGGMGAVFRARHEVLERAIAVKVLRPELTENDELVTRFMNEAKAASAIRHPSIIEVFDFGYTDDGEAYLVMEYLEGESLASRMHRKGRLAEQDAVHIVRSIAGALGAAHGKGIVHRDLKPDNVFIVTDPDFGERAKVLDFGIAKLTGSQAHTQTGALMGTPLYMAPEQARSAHGIDHRADLYSLGCILYELLTGRPPLVGEGTGEIIALHMFTQPDPPSTIVPGISPALESIVMQLLEKEPAARPQTAAEVSNALSSVFGATSRPVLPAGASMQKMSSANLAAAAAPSIAPAPRKPLRGNLPLVAAGVTITLAGVVALVLALGGGDESHKAPPVAQPPPAPRIEQAAPPPTPTPAPPPEPLKQEVVPPPAPPPIPARSGGKKKPLRSTDKGAPIEPTI